eukprot:5085937-Prorocentrum_lima.AAC.1
MNPRRRQRRTPSSATAHLRSERIAEMMQKKSPRKDAHRCNPEREVRMESLVVEADRGHAVVRAL